MAPQGFLITDYQLEVLTKSGMAYSAATDEYILFTPLASGKDLVIGAISGRFSPLERKQIEAYIWEQFIKQMVEINDIEERKKR